MQYKLPQSEIDAIVRSIRSKRQSAKAPKPTPWAVPLVPSPLDLANSPELEMNKLDLLSRDKTLDDDSRARVRQAIESLAQAPAS